MMKRLTVAALVCVCALVPRAARADNGGWLDWLYSLDPKLVGYGTEFRLCFDKMNQVKNCESWFQIPRALGKNLVVLSRDETRHELDFRVAYYHSIGDRFSDDAGDKGSINALKLMAIYYYHADKHVSVGFGFGLMPFFGTARDGETKFELFTRGIVTPISVIYAPFSGGSKNIFYLRAEANYHTTGFSGADFGNTITRFATNGGDWNVAIGTGLDWRRPH